jgi:hypothetical protein
MILIINSKVRKFELILEKRRKKFKRSGKVKQDLNKEDDDKFGEVRPLHQSQKIKLT